MSLPTIETPDQETQALIGFRQRNRLAWTRKLQDNHRLLRQLGRAFPPYLTVGEVEDLLHAESARLLHRLEIRLGSKAHRDILGS